MALFLQKKNIFNHLQSQRHLIDAFTKNNLFYSIISMWKQFSMLTTKHQGHVISENTCQEDFMALMLHLSQRGQKSKVRSFNSHFNFH